MVTPGKGENMFAIQKYDGTFEKKVLPLGFSSDPYEKKIVAGEIIDVDEDGNRDFVISTAIGSKLTILWGNGTGRFSNKTVVCHFSNYIFKASSTPFSDYFPSKSL